MPWTAAIGSEIIRTTSTSDPLELGDRPQATGDEGFLTRGFGRGLLCAGYPLPSACHLSPRRPPQPSAHLALSGGSHGILQAMHLISLESISKSYPETPVLSEVSLGIGRRQRIGVIGRNGSGKSTLLRIIAGIEEPDAGRIVRSGGLRVESLAQDP